MGEEGLTGRRKVEESDERGSGRQSDEITEGVKGWRDRNSEGRVGEKRRWRNGEGVSFFQSIVHASTCINRHDVSS